MNSFHQETEAAEHQPDFVFSIYQDYELVSRLISELRKLYPQSVLICVSDGPIHHPDFVFHCAKSGVRLIETTQRLKLPQFGGQWLERLFSAAIAHTSSPYIIRTEGDTRFWRRFESYPAADLAGTVGDRYGFRFAVGGCVFLRREAVIKILESKLLRDPRYCNNLVYSYPRYSQFKYKDEPFDNGQILLSDLVLGNVSHRLNLKIAPWAEVDIRFRTVPGTGFAATHPHRHFGQK